MSNPLSHLDDKGQARMVDVSAKPVSRREAIAEGFILLQPDTVRAIAQGKVPKGEVLAVARVAGIMAAKRTGELIPLCHPLPLSSVRVDLACRSEPPAVEITATCRSVGRTGVEMEALTAVSVAALTVYDMVKAVEKSMVIDGIRLILKDGGKSGRYEAK